MNSCVFLFIHYSWTLFDCYGPKTGNRTKPIIQANKKPKKKTVFGNCWIFAMIFKVQFSRWFFYIPLDDGRFFFTRSKKNECTPLFRLDDYLCLSVVVMAVHWRFFLFCFGCFDVFQSHDFYVSKRKPSFKKRRKNLVVSSCRERFVLH